MNTIRWIVLGGLALFAMGCVSFPDAQSSRELGEKMVSEAYPGMPEALTKRSHQDKSQQMCSKIGAAKLTQEEAAEVIRVARESMQYPASGKLVGDWKAGEQLAYDGAGERIRGGAVEKLKANGSLCSNCHALAPKEVNVGNLGPSLTGYGAQRGNSEAVVKYTYERIYNGWAYVPCSNMPRLGANRFLTPEQITDLVAYLIDPQSPVNEK
jgi:sulfur-oxidizing protein SoxX